MTKVKLVGLHRAEFEQAKADQARARRARACVAILACVSVLVAVEAVAYIVTVLALIATGLRWFFWWRSKRRIRTAQRARRYLVLRRGLGWRISGKEMVDLLESFSVSESEGQKLEDENYFDSAEGASIRAFSSIIQENAFWSKRLFSLSAKRYWVYTGLGLSAVVILSLAIPGISVQRWSIVVSRLMCIALMLLVANDLLGMSIAFTEAAHTLRIIDDRLEGMAASGAVEPDVIAVFCDCNAAVQGAPLIPTDIYERHRERLRRLWEKRRKTSGP